MGTLALAAAVMCSTASAQTAAAPSAITTIATNRSTAMTLPTSPQELWTRFLILLKKNGGFTNHMEVEETIGLKFTKVENDSEIHRPKLGAEFRYTMKEEVQGIGLLQMALFEDPKKSRLGFSWGPDIYELPNCKNLTLDLVTGEIEALGWVQREPRSLRPGRSSWTFIVRDDIAESAKKGSAVTADPLVSTLTLYMPSQYSQCVNGFAIDVRPTQ